MPAPAKSFLYVFLIMTAFGLLVGTLNLHNPQAVHIPFGVDAEGNIQSAEGADGVIAATLSAAVLGVIFGALAAFLAWVFSRGVGALRKNGNKRDR